MDNLIVTGAVVAFLLLVLPAVVVPFLNQHPTTVDTSPRLTPERIGTRPSSTATTVEPPTDRIAA